jgi:hypothetical protein
MIQNFVATFITVQWSTDEPYKSHKSEGLLDPMLNLKLQDSGG